MGVNMKVTLVAGFLLLTAGTTVLLAMTEWNFDTERVGGLPANWQTRGGSPAGVYRIEVDKDGNQFIAARSHNSDVQLGVAWTAKTERCPNLSWHWRVWELPRDGDERKTATMDSAAAVYAVFGSRLFPTILKYVWSASVPSGTSFKHPDTSRITIIVVASGKSQLGQWRSISRNLIEDYKLAYRRSPGNLIALGIKTDSDSTRSSASADYDAVRLECR
jgi:hypothetical protein